MFPLVLKINYDGHTNGEKYKVPLMTNVVDMIVMKTQRRYEAKSGVEKKILRNTSTETSKSLEFQFIILS